MEHVLKYELTLLFSDPDNVPEVLSKEHYTPHMQIRSLLHLGFNNITNHKSKVQVIPD